MKLSELKGKIVVALDSATKVGTVDNIILNSSCQSIEALVVKTSQRGPEKVIPWKDVRAIGPDAVTVDSAQSAVDFDQMPNLRNLPNSGSVLNSRIVTEGGKALGSVSDIEFDPSSGQVTGIEYGGGPLEALMGRRHTLDPKNVISFSPGMMTVSGAAHPSQAA